MTSSLPRAIGFALLLAISGCAQIPAEAPELSHELGLRVSVLEQSHLNLLHQFFAQKRQDIDRFVEQVWVPTFATEFFADPNIARAWNLIAKENDEQQRLTFLLKTGPKIQQRIYQKRQELIAPLNDLERALEDNLRQNYGEMLAMNHSITGFLTSARKVDENRSRYLAKAGVEESQLENLLNKTDAIVGKLVSGSNQAESAAKKADEYYKKLQKLRESL